jgi:DNA-binding transcriptional LysR family regulator
MAGRRRSGDTAGMTPSPLSGLEVRHLQALQAVAEEGSFRGAAERLGYAQASVSAQIDALERMVGRELLERVPGRPVRLTPAGEAFHGHATAALARLRTGAREAAAADDLPGPARLRLGTYPSVAARLLPPLLGRLAAECPHAEVALTEAAGPEPLEAALDAGELDLAFAVQPLGRPGLASVALREDPYCLLVSRASGLADRTQPATLDELATLSLILSGTCLHLRHLEARLRLHGHEPAVRLHSDDDGLVHNLVAVGDGVAVLTRMQVDPAREDTIAVELADLVPPRIVALAWSPDRGLPALATRFIAWASAAPGRSGLGTPATGTQA